MAAMQGLKVTLLLPFLATCLFSGQAQSVFDIPQCANRRVFTIGRDNQFSITCTGLRNVSNIYWSISSPLTNGTEIRLGECATCYPNCASTNCTVFNSRDYSITRHQSDVTTLTFVDNLEQNQGALIKCSQRNNDTNAQAYCATAFLNATRRPQFNITECNNGAIEILPTQTVSLTCTGLWPLSNIYWSLTGPSTNHTEVRLGDCRSCYPNCSSTPCNVPDNRYSISRPRYDVTVVEDAHLNDSVTFKCSQFNNATTAQSSCTIHIRKGQVQSVVDIPQCANRRGFTIGRDNQFSITCTGLGIGSNIYWSIRSPLTNGTEITLGRCDRCKTNCTTTDCRDVNTRDYSITRHQSDVSTLTFVDNLEQNKGALIKCSQRDNTSQAYCATYLRNATHRPQFQLTECNNGVLEILPSQTVSLTCTGLWPLSNIYWSLTGSSTNHTEVRLGDCPSCYPNCSSTPCNVPDNRYPISRPRYDVTGVEVAHLNDSVTFKCSQWNNATTAQSSCTIHIRKAYQLPQCENGQLDLSAEEPWTAITCEGLRSYHNITWTLTDPDNQTTEIASCTVYSDRNNACSAASAEFVVSRTRDVSELRIVGNVKEKDNNTVTCVRQDGATGESCRLRVISEEQDSPLPDKFPAAAVGGGVAAAVVVVVIVVAVVVFVKWKRRSHSSESGPQSTGLEPVIYENPVDSSESAAGGSYDSLQMSDVGLSSEYSAIGNTNTGSQPQAGQPTHYDSLQVSDIGQVSTYSVIGDNKNTSHCAGGDYEIP